MILQVIGLIGIGAYEFTHVDLEQVQPEALSQEEMEAVAVLLFVPPAILALLAAVGFLFLSRRGWLVAAISEGLSLGISLWLYSEIKPNYVYPIMGYCILMIMYLNSQDVRVVFHSTRDKAKQSRKATHGG